MRTGGVGGLPDAAFRRFFDTLTLPVMVIAEDGTIRYAGGSVQRDLGWDPAEIQGRNIVEFIPEDQVESAIQSMADLADHAELGIGVPTVYAVRRPNGELTWQAVGAVPLTDDPDVQGISFFLLPWDAQLLFDESISALLAGDPVDDVLATLGHSITVSLEAVGAVVHHAYDGATFRSESGFGVPAACLKSDSPTPWQTAATSGEPQYVSREALAGPARAAAAEHGIGGLWAIPLPRSPGIDPAVLSVWRGEALAPVTAHDFMIARSLRYVQLTLLRAAEHAQLAHMATHDSLTGAANRALFHRRLAESLAHGRASVVLFCDLDSFKAINDGFGHRVGDAVLVEASRRLRGRLRETDLLARIGGDEFIVLFEGPVEEAVVLGERMVEAMSEPMLLAGHELAVALSVGIADRGPSSTPDDLLNRADTALYDAKRSGGAKVRVAREPDA